MLNRGSGWEKRRLQYLQGKPNRVLRWIPAPVLRVRTGRNVVGYAGGGALLPALGQIDVQVGAAVDVEVLPAFQARGQSCPLGTDVIHGGIGDDG